MKKIFSIIVALSVVALSNERSYAQADIHFSQFYETSMLRNPSLTGIFSNDYKFGAYYRQQWASISNPFVTALVYGEVRLAVGRVSNDYFSIGLLGYTDKAGSVDQRISAGYPAINYSKCLDPDKNRFLSVGFTAGYTQYSFDASKATFNNQYQGGFFSNLNPTFENITNSKMSMWDIGTGINFNSNTGYNNGITYILGVSGYHLTTPKFSYYDVSSVTEYIRWNVNGAIGFNMQDNVVVTGQANYGHQGAFSEIIAGMNFTWSEPGGGPKPDYSISGGLYYRFQDAIIPVVKVKYKNTAVAASYDVNSSTLKQASNLRGGYEITLSVTGDFYDKSGILKKTVCPKF